MKTKTNTNEDFGSSHTYNNEEYGNKVKYVSAGIKRKLIPSQINT